ncbi:hypothetical protein BCU69_19250 [Vibrio cyclitrophicus]|nr:hypothetical protein BCU69_19250 [Vibrio cyclitrophicus]
MGCIEHGWNLQGEVANSNPNIHFEFKFDIDIDIDIDINKFKLIGDIFNRSKKGSYTMFCLIFDTKNLEKLFIK